jgi:hypothetical protein
LVTRGGNADIKDHIKTTNHKRLLRAGTSTVAPYSRESNAGDSDLKWESQQGTFAERKHVHKRERTVHLRVPVWEFENVVTLFLHIV